MAVEPPVRVPIRREPPPFRRVEIGAVERRTPHLVAVTLRGPELVGLDPGLPAASVRLLLPEHDRLDLPTWNGNEFLRNDGSRPTLRTLTPRGFDADRNELVVEIVLHGQGPLSAWAATVGPGDAAAVSGTGRGYAIDPGGRAYVLVGDESALPAIAVLVEAIPPSAAVTVIAEVSHPDARIELPAHPGVAVEWHDLSPGDAPGDAMVAAVRATAIDPTARVWAAGEAAAVQRIRRHLFDDRGLARSQCTVRGYWKHGRAGDPSPSPARVSRR